jgi:hypothetical protein
MYLDLRNYQTEDSLPEPLNIFLNQNFRHLPPFDPLLLDYCQNLSQQLVKEEDADMTALGFWLRPAHIHELKTAFYRIQTEQEILTPKGLVFHISASNVDTLFAYSWILSLLCGNSNLIRLPSTQSPAISAILEIIQNLLEKKDFSPLNEQNCFMHYGHQEAITTAISASVDMRVIWGSNHTIQTLRRIPLNPYATEIAFPDRFSYGVIDAANYDSLAHEKKQFLAQAFFRDMYGFDQNGCSSPRILFWIGSKSKITKTAQEFSDYLQKEIQSRGYELPLSAFLNKQTLLYVQASKLAVNSIKMPSNELTTVMMDIFDPQCRAHSGGGLLYHIPLKHLHDLIDIVSVQDQTLVYEGITREEIKQLAHQLNGKGPSRFVPFGEALHFSEDWDGHDLLRAFTRKLRI